MQEGTLQEGRLDTIRQFGTIAVLTEELGNPTFHVLVQQIMVVWHALKKQRVALVGIAEQVSQIRQFYLSWIRTSQGGLHVLHR
jgi:hypothetical protein